MTVRRRSLWLLWSLFLFCVETASVSNPSGRRPRDGTSLFVLSSPRAISTSHSKKVFLRSRKQSFVSPGKKKFESLSMTREDPARETEKSSDGASPNVKVSPLLKAVGSTTRYTVSGLVGVLLFTRRDAAALTCVVGALMNAIAGKILKRLLNLSRPPGARQSDPGMPSSHATSLFFLATSAAVCLLRPPVEGGGVWQFKLPVEIAQGGARASLTAVSDSLNRLLLFLASRGVLGMAASALPSPSEALGVSVPAPLPSRVAAAGLLYAYALASLQYRVAMQYHTPAQIAVGAVLGSVNAVGWQWICTGSSVSLNSHVEGLIARISGGSSRVPLPVLLSVSLVGLLTVGSVDRKLIDWWKRKRKEQGKGD
uniref:Phosphatidic acid phosphatase type 2/haloperoxidase domain-containing protein n=1 Tax=Chromera velia CCMP2878 TaxID=1169474 RepID=A0A0G4HKN4_9ALVE|eukprot:Cvel_7241.t1-p1 / transcript=Cvel_7241.t1 / gene=Cvel_7241 / organism=Chromera_velia_CCMP2878 / gene_product=hypothetical protein / transcript_product=hypothetical protein / location=Cvel_scaffold373:71873-74120(+) / protein_length=368 / sequence_SO=supercontig / SO=protein_coding / is_pseudo=false